jgi:hypothetical protein
MRVWGLASGALGKRRCDGLVGMGTRRGGDLKWVGNIVEGEMEEIMKANKWVTRCVM